MARPAKLKTPPPDRPLTITLHEYMARQNELANHIRQYQSLATTLLSYVSQQVGMASQAIGVLQQSTLTALEQNGVDAQEEGLQAFPGIAGLLRMDKAELGNPFAGGFGNALNHMDLSKIAKQAKKQKKPRKPKDPNAPQRPQTAFFLFQMANREQYRANMQAENPDVKPGDVQKRLTETWNAMDYDAQKPYKDKYAKENEQYNLDKAKYERETGKNLPEGASAEGATLGAATPGVEAADASGDADSTDDDSGSDESSESSSEDEPTPPPVKKSKSKSSKKHKDGTSSKEESPEKKRRKHDRDDSDEETPKKKRKAKEVESDKKKKKKKNDPLIDPELTRQDKEQRKQKHPEYAPAQPTFGGPGPGMAPMAGMGSMLQNHMNNLPWQTPR